MATTKDKKVSALKKVVKGVVAKKMVNKMDESKAHEAMKGDMAMDAKECSMCKAKGGKCDCKTMDGKGGPGKKC
mgnify:CR=1 FL=1